MQTRPTRIILLGVLFLTAARVAWGQEGKGQGHSRGAGEGEQAGSPASAKIDQAAPDFTLLDCNGTKHALSDYKDKVVVLEWVNKTCPWSVKAIPVMKALHKKYADKGVVWLGIDSTWSRKPDENVQYIKDKELDFAILMDSDGKVGHLYGARNTPQVFVIRKGTLVYMGGLHNDQYEKKPSEFRNYVDEALAAVLAGKDVPMAETTPWGCRVGYKETASKSDSSREKSEQDKTEKEK